VIGFIVGFAAVLGLMTSPAQAVTLNVDYSTIDISGGIVVQGGVAATMTNDLVGGGSAHGSLTTTAFWNAAHTLITYEAKFIPVVNEISIISTSFAPAGLTGSIGWSFQDATNAGYVGSASTAFAAASTALGLEWDRDLSQMFWGANQQMRFFFQSTLLPGTASFGIYNQSNASIGSAVGLMPVAAPEPMTLLLLSSGLAGAGVWARWGRRDA
jgi:hypothetical protein